mmetsp:Transcript_33095/g.71525  ORF Transcript_33095/g.71525 Transcript_33095/m.71525 type:complete len:135 (+) Transcript_33095:348-752(+)
MTSLSIRMSSSDNFVPSLITLLTGLANNNNNEEENTQIIHITHQQSLFFTAILSTAAAAAAVAAGDEVASVPTSRAFFFLAIQKSTSTYLTSPASFASGGVCYSSQPDSDLGRPGGILSHKVLPNVQYQNSCKI